MSLGFMVWVPARERVSERERDRETETEGGTRERERGSERDLPRELTIEK